jgi:hypothetical protein
MASINKLKSIFNKRGPALANRFKVDFSGMSSLNIGASPDDLRELSYLVDSSVMPGRQLQTFGYDLFRHPTEVPTGYVNEGFSIEFNMTADMMPKRVFDSWINLVVDSQTYLMKYADEFKCSMQIIQTDLADKKKYVLELDQVFPKTIRGISYSQSSGDLTKFGVEFAYNDIRIWDEKRFSESNNPAWPEDLPTAQDFLNRSNFRRGQL